MLAHLASDVMAARPESLFFRSLEPATGWDGGRAAVAASQRARLLDAITRAVAEKGYGAVTVADVVGRAGVSRRTFYEHFADKEACFLAAYEAGTDAVIGDVVATLGDEGGDWRDQLAAAMSAYTATLAAEPEFARALLIDVLGAGPRAVELRQQVVDRFVAHWRAVGELACRQEQDLGAVPEVVLRALVGGIGELVQRHVLTEGAETLGALAPVLTQLAVRVIERGGGAAGGS
jgi:AcrR family transcriptional regulator